MAKCKAEDTLDLLRTSKCKCFQRKYTKRVCCGISVSICNFVLLSKNKVLHIQIQNESGCSTSTRPIEKNKQTNNNNKKTNNQPNKKTNPTNQRKWLAWFKPFRKLRIFCTLQDKIRSQRIICFFFNGIRMESLQAYIHLLYSIHIQKRNKFCFAWKRGRKCSAKVCIEPH